MREQTGAALITGLIFLVVLTLVSMAGMRTTLMEQRMATNSRNRDLAFQAAEAALREGIAKISSGTYNTTSGFIAGCTTTVPKGLCMPSVSTNATPIWNTVFPAGQTTMSNQAATYSGTLAGVVNQPQYIIELLPAAKVSGLNSMDDGHGNSTTTTPYRITARGWGGVAEAQATVQATYIDY